MGETQQQAQQTAPQVYDLLQELEQVTSYAQYWRRLALSAMSELCQIKRQLAMSEAADVATLPFGD